LSSSHASNSSRNSSYRHSSYRNSNCHNSSNCSNSSNVWSSSLSSLSYARSRVSSSGCGNRSLKSLTSPAHLLLLLTGSSTATQTTHCQRSLQLQQATTKPPQQPQLTILLPPTWPLLAAQHTHTMGVTVSALSCLRQAAAHSTVSSGRRHHQIQRSGPFKSDWSRRRRQLVPLPRLQAGPLVVQLAMLLLPLPLQLLMEARTVVQEVLLHGWQVAVVQLDLQRHQVLVS
jgi:hypothetical protein